MTKQKEIEQLRRDLAASTRLVNDLKGALNRVFRTLGGVAPDITEARRLCHDTSPVLAWKVDVWDQPECGRSHLVGRQLFHTRGAAEEYAEACDDSSAHVGKTRPGDTEFA